MPCALEVLGELARFVPHTTFTKVQERVIPALLSSDDNVVVAAPTGSGKTLLLEVAMLKLFHPRMTSAASPSCSGVDPVAASRRDTPKAVYVCPIKALAHEKYELWRGMFAPLSVVIETGDQDYQRQRQQQEASGSNTEYDGLEEEGLSTVTTADVIITTPERWDSITRRWREHTVLSIVNSVGLLLLDEVHTVHEERGAALEAIVSRMKAIKAQQGHGPAWRTPLVGFQLRFVAISGTLPNIEDFAEWLQVKPSMTFSFSAQDRPVPLTIRVLGFPSDRNNPFAFDRFLSFKLFGLIRQYSQGKPTIVFCASRKEAAGSALRLVADIRAEASRQASGGGRGGGDGDGPEDGALEPSQAVLDLANSANDRQLRQCLLLGIAYHHAALTMHDRLLVERMFREHFVVAVCTTTTLALGVNLPAHLVIVKGTTFFKGGKRDDVPLSEVAQMCGRAGRPGLDDHGIALVLTTESSVRLYESLVDGDAFTTVESQLHRSMIEHANAEVALRTIHSFASGLEWIRTTLFWIRLRRCPRHYGLTFATKAEEASFRPEEFAERLMRRVLTTLYEEECIDIRQHADALVTEEDSGANDDGGRDVGSAQAWNHLADRDGVIESTRIGRNMARMYILFDTVKTFNDEVRKRRSASTGKVGDAAATEEDGHHVASEENNVGDEDRAADEGNADTEKEGGPGQTTRRAPEQNRRRCPLERLFAQGAQPPRLHRPFGLRDVVALCCRSAEFAEVGLRQGDRGPLNEMNRLIKFPITSGHKGGREVREDWHKSFVLLQGQLAQVAVAEVSLRNDLMRLWTVVPRVARFLCEYARFTGSYSFHLFAHLLLRCVEQKVWPDGLVLKQLDGVSDAVARSLSRAGYREFQSICDADPRRLEAICGRLPPYGTQLQVQAREMPRCTVTVQSVSPEAPGNQGAVRRYTVTIAPTPAGEGTNTEDGVANPAEGVKEEAAPRARRRRTIRGFLLAVGAPRQDRVLLLRYVPASAILAFSATHGKGVAEAKPPCFEFTVPRDLLTGATSAPVEVALLAEHWVGADITLTFTPHPGHQSIAADSTSMGGRPKEAGLLSFSSSSASPSPSAALTGSHSLTTVVTSAASAKVKTPAAPETAAGKRNASAKKGPIEVHAAKRVTRKPPSDTSGEAPTHDDTRVSVATAEARQTAVETERPHAEETAQSAKTPFDEMMLDLQYIRGESRTPSSWVNASEPKRVASEVAPLPERTPRREAAFPACEDTSSRKRPREEQGARTLKAAAALPATRARTPSEDEEATAAMGGGERRVNFCGVVADTPPAVDGRGDDEDVCRRAVRIRHPDSPAPRQLTAPAATWDDGSHCYSAQQHGAGVVQQPWFHRQPHRFLDTAPAPPAALANLTFPPYGPHNDGTRAQYEPPAPHQAPVLRQECAYPQQQESRMGGAQRLYDEYDDGVSSFYAPPPQRRKPKARYSFGVRVHRGNPGGDQFPQTSLGDPRMWPPPSAAAPLLYSHERDGDGLGFPANSLPTPSWYARNTLAGSADPFRRCPPEPPWYTPTPCAPQQPHHWGEPPLYDQPRPYGHVPPPPLPPTSASPHRYREAAVGGFSFPRQRLTQTLCPSLPMRRATAADAALPRQTVRPPPAAAIHRSWWW